MVWLLMTGGLNSTLYSSLLPSGPIVYFILLFPTVSHIQMLSVSEGGKEGEKERMREELMSFISGYPA